MNASTPERRPKGRSGLFFALVIVGLAAALGAFFWSRSKAPSRPAHRAEEVIQKSTWKNRALAWKAEPAAAEPSRPVIRGNVYDVEGTPLPSSTLVALTYDLAGNMASPRGTFQSAADGSFEIPLPQGTYQLNVSKDGYGPTTVVAQTGETVSVVLPRGGTLTGKVVDEKGRPVRRFTLDLVAAAPGDAPAPPPIWSKAFDTKEGTFQTGALPAWPVIARAVSPDFAPGFSSPLQLRPGDTREITITLSAGCVVEGKVVDREGNPLPRVLVNAEERLAAGAITDPVLQASLGDVSGDDGSFRLEHVPRGAVLLRGYDGDNAPGSLAVDVKECDKLAPVKLVMSPGGSVEGTAHTAEGKPAAGARLTIVDRMVGIVNTESDAAGRFRFETLPAGMFRIELNQDAQSVVTYVQVKDGATSHVDLTLFGQGSGELRGKVVTGDKPLAGARLLVASNHGRAKGIAMYFPVTGPDGTFRVPALPPGAYLVNVMSTPAGQGVEVKKDEVATISLDVAPALGAVLPTNAAAPTPHPSRLRQMRQQQQAADDGAEGATPQP